MRVPLLFGALSIGLPCSSPQDASRAGSAAQRVASRDDSSLRQDSAAARQALQRYMLLMSSGQYEAAAKHYAGDWRLVANNLAQDPAIVDSVSLTGLLRLACQHHAFQCQLRLRRVEATRFVPPDTLLLVVEYEDPSGAQFHWPLTSEDSGTAQVAEAVPIVKRSGAYFVTRPGVYIQWARNHRRLGRSFRVSLQEEPPAPHRAIRVLDLPKRLIATSRS